jgi:hypothetical protein
MTPLDISILIHACCRADAVPNRSAMAVEESIGRFVSMGIVTLGPEPNHITATEDGHAWLAAIRMVPRPTKGWFDATGACLDHMMPPSPAPATSMENQQ